MALGGGTFTSMNKAMPGSYINVISSLAVSAALGDRGIAAIPMPLNYSPEGVFKVTSADFQKNTRSLFGCEYTAEEMKPLRDVFANASTVYLYNVLTGGKAASNTYATAKYTGKNGNSFKIRIDAVVDDTSKLDVITLLGNIEVDKQRITKTSTSTSDNGLKDNDYVTFKKTAAITAAVAAVALSGGTTGTTADYQSALDELEGYRFNTLGCVAGDNTTKGLFVNYTKRLRDDMGLKFQTVVHDYAGADSEGVISVKNSVYGATSTDDDYTALVYWVTGAEAACAVNKSLTNHIYGGEFIPDTAYTQSELESYLENGYFVLHNVDDDVRCLVDKNTLLTYTEDKGEVFSSNQTIRVTDQIAMDIASIFNSKYLGMIQNNSTGRALFKADIVEEHNLLQDKGAIEGFTADNVTIEAGNKKGVVIVTDLITVVGTMEQLYMTVYVS